jgi:citronellol/citronellal dehydrogenase
VDVGDDVAVYGGAQEAAERFGGIDVLANNTSAHALNGKLDRPMKRFDLTFGVNVRGTNQDRLTRAGVKYLDQDSVVPGTKDFTEHLFLD